MILTDAEILEIGRLCDAVVDETLTEAQRVRLTAWLVESAAAREFYVRALSLSASLHTYASEMQTGAASRPHRLWTGTKLRWLIPLAAAAVLVLAFWLNRAPVAAVRSEDFVARVTGVNDALWAGAPAAPQPGDHLYQGQRLELVRGRVEITFDSGARVVLDGPASLDINSAWDGTLRQGTLTAHVPPEAIGFYISNPSVEVVDLGTEFTMIADHGVAEVFVLKGQVEAAPRTATAQRTILLNANDALRFAGSGVTEVSDSGKRFAQFARPAEFDRFTPPFHFAHWSFDESDGARFSGTYSAGTTSELAAHLETSDHAAFDQAYVAGRSRQALRFDGRLLARTSFPGISELSTHTVSFWVKVPADAELSNAYSMISWRASDHKLAYRAVQISWNRNPAEGAIGALRTDFSGGCAIGSTSLRDGRWHYVTVVIIPSENTTPPLQVKQYLDGRLESSSVIPGRIHGPGGSPNTDLNDVVWLGSRLGTSGPRKERFRGELDELFITDRGLEPHEIVSLMNDNRLPSADAVMTGAAPTVATSPHRL